MTEATPSGVVIEALAPDGRRTNITEGVQALYDLVIQSMDWGSGFLSMEEVVPIYDLARACGFKGWESAQAYVADEQHKVEAQAYRQANPEAARHSPYRAHAHVFSSVGRCMVWNCAEKDPHHAGA